MLVSLAITSGIFFPDNFVTVTAEFGPSLYATSYGLFNILLPILDPNLVNTPEIKQHFEKEAPLMIAAFTPLMGILINQRRFAGLPIHEAKFLDDKIREHYQANI